MSFAENALAGIKIIDLTSMIAGPTMGRLFGELGADVIHVEPPHGDDGRNSTTPYLGREGVIYSVANRSKRGIVLDLKQERGLELMYTLLQNADIFVENMRPGVAERMGLGYDELSRGNPRLVYVSITGWGQDGPLKNAPGYDVLLQGFSGIMRRPNEEMPPQFSGAMVGDPSAPLLAAFAVMVALRDRESTGRGRHITTSLLQGALHVQATRAVAADQDPNPRHERKAPGGQVVVSNADGQFTVVCAWTDAQFRRLCELAGFEEGATNEAYATRPGREEHAIALNEVISAWASTLPRAEFIALLQSESIPCSPVYSGIRELMDDPHVRANEMVVPVEHPTKGRIWQVGAGFEIDGERGVVRPAPLFGQHTDEVMREHGLTEDEIASLRADGVIA